MEAEFAEPARFVSRGEGMFSAAPGNQAQLGVDYADMAVISKPYGRAEIAEVFNRMIPATS